MDLTGNVPTKLRRALALSAAVIVGLSASGCGGPDAGESGSTSIESPSANPGETSSQSESATVGASIDTGETSPPVGFCAQIEGIDIDLTYADLSAEWQSDPQGFVDGVGAAAGRFGSADPPEAISEAWKFLTEFFTMVAQALEGVDGADADAVQDALRLEGDEAFAMIFLLPGEVETVGMFVQEECGIDVGLTPPLVEDVCDLFDAAALGSVFPDEVPEGEERTWGHGVVECLWDDRQRTEVGVVFGPEATVLPDLVHGQEPTATIETDLGPLAVYDGAVGPLRAASGRTVAASVEETALLVSVRSGEAMADQDHATDLVRMILEVLR